MYWLLPVETLGLRSELIMMLKDNGIVSIDDFINRSITVFKQNFHLTFDDWQSILKEIISRDAQSEISDEILKYLLKKSRKKDPRCNAFIINLFDERYVVSTIREGKRIHEDFVFKSLARGVVFSSREDAQQFAELICAKAQTRIVTYDIKSAQYTINVIVACIADGKHSVICYEKNKNKAATLEFLSGIDIDSSEFDVHKACRNARKAVERINRIYDYEIASSSLFVCEEGKFVQREFAPQDAPLQVYCVDRSKYTEALKQQIDNEQDDFFVWGKNAALLDGQCLEIATIEKNIAVCFEKLENFKEDAGITQEDVIYEKGYIEGLRIACDIQKDCICHSLRGWVAIIDCFDAFSKCGVLKENMSRSVTEGKSEIMIDYFDSLEELQDNVAKYDAFYVAYSGKPSRAEKVEFCALKKKFFDQHKRVLQVVNFSSFSKKEFFNILFL